MMEAILTDNGYAAKAYTRSFEAVEEFKGSDWDLVISDVKMPGMDGLEVLQRIKEKCPGMPVIMITAFATVEMSIQALRRGAYDILTKPFEPEELLYRVKNALKQTELLEENQELRQELVGKFRFDNIIGATTGLRPLMETVAKIAIRDTSVLITGESGTGKELIAQAIHYNSPRRDKRFLAINCGALPESLLESELFGYKKGAFTGATENRQGLLERSHPVGHQRRPACRRRKGHLSRRSLLPSQRGESQAPSPAGAPRGHPSARDPLHQAAEREIRHPDQGALQ